MRRAARVDDNQGPPCLMCGKPCHLVGKNAGKYCSRQCVGRAVGLNGAARYRAAIRHHSCEICGKAFSDYYDDKRFCSRTCFGISRRGIVMRRAGRKDKNQNSIVAALKAAGCSVFDTSSLGNGVPDLIVSSPGGWVLMEVKNPENSYGKHGLNENQVKWASEWKGGDVHVVRTIEDALALVVPTAEEALEVMGR